MSDPRPLVVVAPDSFKGSCTAAEAAAAMARGVRQAMRTSCRIREIPLADGGEGTLDALIAAWGGTVQPVETLDALGRTRTARLGLSADGRTAIIEAAEANGLPHIADLPPGPLDADTRGVGLLALAALRSGATEILLCVGGSATSDGGAGLLGALGARLLDAAGNEVSPGPRGLARISRIDLTGLEPAARAASWRVAVDVDNPLTGPNGAATVFGPQKGATPADVAVIDAALSRFAAVLAAGAGETGSALKVAGSGVYSGADPGASSELDSRAGPGAGPVSFAGEDRIGAAHPGALAGRPGMGAAGGLPLALVAALGARLVRGADLVATAVDLDAALAEAALVITGEGRLDAQSLQGKAVSRILSGVPCGTPVIAVVGSLGLSAQECRAAGLAAAFSIAQGPATLEELTARTPELLAEAAAHACALFAATPSAG